MCCATIPTSSSRVPSASRRRSACCRGSTAMSWSCRRPPDLDGVRASVRSGRGGCRREGKRRGDDRRFRPSACEHSSSENGSPARRRSSIRSAAPVSGAGSLAECGAGGRRFPQHGCRVSPDARRPGAARGACRYPARSSRAVERRRRVPHRDSRQPAPPGIACAASNARLHRAAVAALAVRHAACCRGGGSGWPRRAPASRRAAMSVLGVETSCSLPLPGG